MARRTKTGDVRKQVYLRKEVRQVPGLQMAQPQRACSRKEESRELQEQALQEKGGK